MSRSILGGVFSAGHDRQLVGVDQASWRWDPFQSWIDERVPVDSFLALAIGLVHLRPSSTHYQLEIQHLKILAPLHLATSPRTLELTGRSVLPSSITWALHNDIYSGFFKFQPCTTFEWQPDNHASASGLISKTTDSDSHICIKINEFQTWGLGHPSMGQLQVVTLVGIFMFKFAWLLALRFVYMPRIKRTTSNAQVICINPDSPNNWIDDMASSNLSRTLFFVLWPCTMAYIGHMHYQPIHINRLSAPISPYRGRISNP